jgi:hypothetical protein
MPEHQPVNVVTIERRPETREKQGSVNEIPSPALSRLLEEVRVGNKEAADPTAYNRFHNRHNR